MGSGFLQAGLQSQACGLTVRPADGQAFPSTRLWHARAEGDRATVPLVGLWTEDLGTGHAGSAPRSPASRPRAAWCCRVSEATWTPPGSQWPLPQSRDRVLRWLNPFRDGGLVTSRGGRPSVLSLGPPPLLAPSLPPQPESVRPTGQAHTFPPPTAPEPVTPGREVTQGTRPRDGVNADLNRELRQHPRD